MEVLRYGGGYSSLPRGSGRPQSSMAEYRGVHDATSRCDFFKNEIIEVEDIKCIIRRSHSSLGEYRPQASRQLCSFSLKISLCANFHAFSNYFFVLPIGQKHFKFCRSADIGIVEVLTTELIMGTTTPATPTGAEDSLVATA